VKILPTDLLARLDLLETHAWRQ